MLHFVEVRRIDTDAAADLMDGMRDWLATHQIEPVILDRRQTPPGLLFRVAFREPHHAVLFAEAFDGRLTCTDPHGSPLWSEDLSEA